MTDPGAENGREGSSDVEEGRTLLSEACRTSQRVGKTSRRTLLYKKVRKTLLN
jgi:hypothetical protein